MKVAYTAHRRLADQDLDTINNRITQIVLMPEIDEMIFGGANGGDSHALRFAARARKQHNRELKLTVVCPDTLAALPMLARGWAQQFADQYFELRNPIRQEDGWASFDLRNRFMVDRVAGQGWLDAFWSGRKPSGTWNAIQYAISCGVPWVHIPIIGADT